MNLYNLTIEEEEQQERARRELLDIAEEFKRNNYKIKKHRNYGDMEIKECKIAPSRIPRF